MMRQIVKYVFLFLLFFGFTRGVEYDTSVLYDYIEQQYELDETQLPELGLALVTLRSNLDSGTDAYLFLTTAIHHVRASQGRVSIPNGYRVVTYAKIEQMREVFHIQGNEGVPLLVIEFADFQCPYCQRQNKSGLLEELRIAYPHNIQTAFAHFPLGGSYHVLAEDAALAAECVYDQVGEIGFYEFKDRSFLTSLQPTLARMKGYASAIDGVDIEQFVTCIENKDTIDRVHTSKNIWLQLGVKWTPYTAVIDTRSGAYITLWWVQTLESIRQQIDIFLAQK